MCFHRRFDYLQCPNCGCRMNAPDSNCFGTSRYIYCRNCRTPLKAIGFKEKTSFANQDPPTQGNRRYRLWILLFVGLLALSFSGCDQATYDRGYKAGDEDGYERGVKEGLKTGKRLGYINGSASFVSGTIAPNAGLVISTAIFCLAASWLSINFIAPRHRAKQAEYDAQHSVEKTREQLQQKTEVAVQSEIDRMQANLVLEKHEHSIRSKLEELYAEATLLLLHESMNVVDQLCDLHLRTISEIASASDLSNEERVLLFPAVTKQLSTVSKRIHSDA